MKIIVVTDRIKRICFALIIIFLSQNPAVRVNAAYGSAEEAIQAALSDSRYLMLIFYDKDNEALKKMESAVNEAVKTSSPAPIVYKALTSDRKEYKTVSKYGINRAPLPLLLVFAPNGAMTGGFPAEVKKVDLKKSLSVNKLEMEVMKPLQEGKVALVLLQNKNTKYNKASEKAALEFQNDSRLKGYVEIIKADPENPDNKNFMDQCRLEGRLTEASIVLLAPPGTIGGVYKGKTTKDELIGGLSACAGGSCGSGGCSDRRFKTDIAAIDNPLDKVSGLDGVTFSWDREKHPLRLFPEGRKMGLIAQDVETVVPEVVNTDSEGYKSIEYDKLVPLLIEAVKEMRLQIQEQEKRIIELEKLMDEKSR